MNKLYSCKLNSFLLILGLILLGSNSSSGQIISTIAGTGTASFSGDGGLATAATIYNTYGVAVDNSGNFYISDLNNYCIRKVNTSGIITTIAGTPGSAGFSGDGG